MCGIAGFSLKNSARATKAALAPMAKALAHRGPDGDGFFTHQNVGLAHRRLSIIDVDGGRQPLLAGSKDAPVALVANGEIYNYRQLQALLAEGSTLVTQSDCEPPLHRFIAMGDAAWDSLEGMYALAVADGRDGALHLAVDPFGIKPLYYCEGEQGFAFASEPRALVAGGFATPSVNMEVLGGLLNRHYSTGKATLFKGIYRMVPGERMVVKDGKVVQRSRKLPGLLAAAPWEGGDAAAAFGKELEASVARHLQADVPYGILLSGGLDSTALMVAMKSLGAPIHAYTAMIDVEGGLNEADVAKAVAKKLGATHTTVKYGRKDFWDALPKLAWAMDDLATDYAALPLLKLTARAREDVKILLSGEGGDEMLAGYGNYRKKQNLLRWWKARRAGDVTPFRRMFRTSLPVPPPPVQPWSSAGFTALQKKQAQDVAGWLPNDLLLKLDRTTMVNGIEGRVPYLDEHFSRFAFSLPDSLKVQDKWGKHIVREHLDRHGLGELAWARKQGFSVAVGAFMAEKTGQLERLWTQSEVLQEILKPTATRGLLGNLDHGKCANLCFSLTLLALWEAIHVRGTDVGDVWG